jgi:subfamily B ATP-binding cassette protein MsbA
VSGESRPGESGSGPGAGSGSGSASGSGTTPRAEKLAALGTVARHDPGRFAAVVVLSLLAATFEGLGLSFLLPIVERATADDLGGPTGGAVGAFAAGYAALGVPFTLGTTLAGAGAVVGLRFATAVLVRYLRVRLVTDYVRGLKTDVFDAVLAADLAYVDGRGSDDLLNTLVTQSNYPAKVLGSVLKLVENGLLAAVYVAIALAVEPVLTVAAAVVLGGVTLLVRTGVGPAYDAGGRVAAANRAMQSHAQSGVQGIREVRLFGLDATVADRYAAAVDDYVDSTVSLAVNRSLVSNLHQFATAVVVLGLVYAALTWSALSLGAVGLFFFTMLRLAPTVSALHGGAYFVDGELPHLVETLADLRDLRSRPAVGGGDGRAPAPVASVALEGVTFRYPVPDGDGDAAGVDAGPGPREDSRSAGRDGGGLTDASFRAERGEFVAVVGESGAGKSTVVSLLARLYDPDAGAVRANGVDLRTVDAADWRRRIAVVRQDPYVFDDTLRNNVLVGRPDADEAAVRRACADAGVDRFARALPAGYGTPLGEDAVRLSGGQRQRIAIARALLRDPDVLLLDEATSNLDVATEREVLAAVRAAASGRIVVAVTHRLGSVADADRIYAVADGRVVESGRHADLVAADGPYADLFAAREGAPRPDGGPSPERDVGR